jgi:Fe-S-cluster-containing dehydrogenase component
MPADYTRPGYLVDLRRCIGCHACAVACKTAHEVPLGRFNMRVRWLPRPDRPTFAFVPVYSETHCCSDPESASVGLAPACVRACPTDALVHGDLEGAFGKRVEALGAKPLPGASREHDLKENVVYLGAEKWMAAKLHRGAALDPRDEDPIYEQA